MKKILILSLLFALFAGSAEAKQNSWKHHIPIDEMTGKKEDLKENVWSAVSIEGKPSWVAYLSLPCGWSRSMFNEEDVIFTLNRDKNSEYEPVKLDSSPSRGMSDPLFGSIISSINPNLSLFDTRLRIKFDNNEPFVLIGMTTNIAPDSAYFFRTKLSSILKLEFPYVVKENKELEKEMEKELGKEWEKISTKELEEVREEMGKKRKEFINKMIKHRRLWIEFNVRATSYIAKYDLTGFSRELAKCSKIPDTN